MSNEKSPYASRANSPMWRQRRATQKPLPAIGSGFKVAGNGHRFQPAVKLEDNRELSLCLRCGKPRFAIEWEKCHAKK